MTSQNDLAWLTQELIKNSDKVRRVRSVAAVQMIFHHDDKLHPDFMGRSVSRLLAQFLVKDWLRTCSTFSMTHSLGLALQRDSKVAHTIFYRIACCGLDHKKPARFQVYVESGVHTTH